MPSLELLSILADRYVETKLILPYIVTEKKRIIKYFKRRNYILPETWHF